MKKVKKERLTVENLRERTGIICSDEEAEKIVYSIRELASIFVEYTLDQEAKAKKEKEAK